MLIELLLVQSINTAKYVSAAKQLEDMKTIVAVELTYSSVRTVLSLAVIIIILYCATKTLMVPMIVEKQKAGLTGAMVHPPKVVVDVVDEVVEVAVVVTKTLYKVTTNKINLTHNNPAQMLVARI